MTHLKARKPKLKLPDNCEYEIKSDAAMFEVVFKGSTIPLVKYLDEKRCLDWILLQTNDLY
jgi:hypothetical protein